MGIADYIQRKKNELFVARDADKLEIQKAALAKERERLAKEREEMQSVRDLQAAVRKERSAVHDLKTQGSREAANKLFSGFKRLNENVKRFGGEEKKPGFVQNVSALGTADTGYFRQTLEFKQKSPFVVDHSPRMAEEKKPKGRTVVINL